MDERIAIWNILRGGKITAVSEDGDTLTASVSVPYIRRRIKPMGDSFVLTLTGVRRAEWRGFDSSGPASTIHEGLEIDAPEIAGTDSRAMPITIGITLGDIFLNERMSIDETMRGQIILDFQKIRFALDTGQSSDYQTIYRVYEEYWEENWNETFKTSLH